MVSSSKEMVAYCFDTLVGHYSGEVVPPPAFEEGRHPLFVTWKIVVDGERSLRGCIGALEGISLYNGLKTYALTSALRDQRFPAIDPVEIPYLECTVSILTDYEGAGNYLDWEVGKHGLIMEFDHPDNNIRLSGTFLPEVAPEQGWTKTETIESLVKKTGYKGAITQSLLQSLTITRYQTTLCTMHYNDYVTFVKRTRSGSSLM